MTYKTSVFYPTGCKTRNRKISLIATDNTKRIDIEIRKNQTPERLEDIGKLRCDIRTADARDDQTLSFANADALRKRIHTNICDEHGNLAVENDNDAIIRAILKALQ